MSCSEQALVWLSPHHEPCEAGGVFQNRNAPYFWLTTLSSPCITVAELRGAAHQIRTLDKTQTAVKETKLQKWLCCHMCSDERQLQEDKVGPPFLILEYSVKLKLLSIVPDMSMSLLIIYETTLFILFIILNTELRVCVVCVWYHYFLSLGYNTPEL